jgi:hypothetical protein
VRPLLVLAFCCWAPSESVHKVAGAPELLLSSGRFQMTPRRLPRAIRDGGRPQTSLSVLFGGGSSSFGGRAGRDITAKWEGVEVGGTTSRARGQKRDGACVSKNQRDRSTVSERPHQPTKLREPPSRRGLFWRDDVHNVDNRRATPSCLLRTSLMVGLVVTWSQDNTIWMMDMVWYRTAR